MADSAAVDPAALLVATCKYNQISIEQGYAEADMDEDGHVSEADLVGFCQQVRLGCSDDAVRAFFQSLDTQGAGYVEEEAWVSALQAAEHRSEQLLASRGISSAGTAGMHATSTAEGSQGTGTAMDVDTAADQLAAALQYNQLAPADAFDELDSDGDSKISIDDLRAAAEKLGLSISKEILLALHAGMDTRSNGFIERDAWCDFLANRNTADVLRSRGVDESHLSEPATEAGVRADPTTTAQEHAAPGSRGAAVVDSADYPPSTGDMTRVDVVSNNIAALLKFNELSAQDGFEAFDIDEDNLISLEDLIKASQQLSLDVDEESLTHWFQLYNKSGGRDERGQWRGAMTMEEWCTVIEDSNPAQVLASRGVSVVGDAAQDQAPATTGTSGDVEAAAQELAAALRYNDLNALGGFDALDVDGDGRISVTELQEAAQTLALQATPDVLVQLHSAMDDLGDGLVQLDSWTRYLDMRWGNTDSVLRSRGVAVVEGKGEGNGEGEGKQPSSAVPAESDMLVINSGTFNTATFAHVQSVSDTIAALLDYNELSHLDGFEAFDVDEDDKVSLGDLTTAAEKMMLDASAEKLAEWFRVVNVAGNGMMSFDEWDAALGYANSEDVLRSRGVVLADSAGTELRDPDSSGNLPPNSAPVPETEVPPLVSVPEVPQPTVLREEPDTRLPQLRKDVGGAAALGSESGGPGASASPMPVSSIAQGVASVEESSGLASVASAPLTPNSAVRKVTDTIAALLQYSGLSVEEGFGEFDVDQDDRVSFQDLTSSSESLELDLSSTDLRLWYEAVDPTQPPVGIALDAWIRVLSNADAESVLKSRGVEASALPVNEPAERVAADTASAPQATYSAGAPISSIGGMSPEDVSNHLAALLRFNELALPDAFHDFDDDGDGKVSMQDMDAAAAQLETDINAQDLKAWHRRFNTAGDGYMSEQEWMAALDGANAEAVLKSRGVDTGAPRDMAVVMRVAEAIAASLKHNEIDVDEGFQAFDMDENDRLSMEDLVEASTTLQLDLAQSDLEEFLSHVEKVGGGSGPEQQHKGWRMVLDKVDGTTVLQARGLVPDAGPSAPVAGVQNTDAVKLTLELPKSPEKGTDEQPPPTVLAEAAPAAVLPAAAVPAVQATQEASPTQSPSEQKADGQEPAVVLETTVQAPVANADKMLAAATEHPESAAQSPGPQNVAAAVPVAQSANDVPAAPDAAVDGSEAGGIESSGALEAAPVISPGDASAASEATASPEVLACMWEDAVPFTLTLDVDFDTIGDHEAFKQAFIKDVAAAGNLDPKYVKIAALRAGSVIVDVLIAQEAGDPSKIVQDLKEQARLPDSRLRQGNLTSKTKGFATPAAAAALPASPLPAAPADGAADEELEGKLEEAQDALGTLNYELEKLKKDSAAHVEVLEQEIADLKDELESEKFDHARFRKDSVAHVAELEKDIALLQKEFDSAKQSCAQLQARLAEKGAAIHEKGDSEVATAHPQAGEEIKVQVAVDVGFASSDVPADILELRQQLENEQAARTASLQHVQSLENEIEALKKSAGTSAGAQDGDVGGGSDKEVEALKVEVSSLKFQLQELQGAAADTPRGQEAEVKVKKVLEPPPHPSMNTPSGARRTPSTDSSALSGGPSSSRRRNVLEPPPDASSVFSGESSGRRSAASSRKASPERLAPPASPPGLSSSPTDPSAQVTQERDEARAALTKVGQELTELRTELARLKASSDSNALRAVGADLARASAEVVSQATIAALGEHLLEVQSAVAAGAAVEVERAGADASVKAAEGHVVTAELAQLQAELAQLQDRMMGKEGELGALMRENAQLKAAQLQAEVDRQSLLASELSPSADVAVAVEQPPAHVAPAVAAPSTDLPSLVILPPTGEQAAELAQLNDKIKALEGELAARSADNASVAALASQKDALDAEVIALKHQVALMTQLAEDARSGKEQTTQELNVRLAEALSQTSAEQAKAQRLQDDLDKLKESFDKSKADVTELKKEKIELLGKVEEADRIQRTASVKQEEEAAGTKSSLKLVEVERNGLRDEVQALKVQIAEIKGREQALQDELSRKSADLAALKDSYATEKLESSKAALEIARLVEVEKKLQERLATVAAEGSRHEIEAARLQKEIEEYNGTRYGEVESLKALLEIERKEKESLKLATTIESLASGAASREASPQKRGGDAYFGAMEEDLRVSSGALSNVQQMLASSPLTEFDKEINRLRQEITSPSINGQPQPQPQPQPLVSQASPSRAASAQFAGSPSRRSRQDRDLQERLDLLAAALSYNGLTVLSGYSAFDQDRDGRVSMEDLRKSMSDLELMMPHAELQTLFTFMDTDRDGFISEIEWSTALRDADPFSVLASQGVRTLEINVPPDADAPLQAVDAFESIKNELAKSLEAQQRMKANLDQALRIKAELEEDLRRIRQTRSELEAELKLVREQMREQMFGAARGEGRLSKAAADGADPAELMRLREALQRAEHELEVERRKGVGAGMQVRTTVVEGASGEELVRLRQELQVLRAQGSELQSMVKSLRENETRSSRALLDAQASMQLKDEQNSQLVSRCSDLEKRLANATQTSSQVPPASRQASEATSESSCLELENVKRELEQEKRRVLDLTKALEDEKRRASEAATASKQQDARVVQLEAELAGLQKRYNDTQELFQKACEEREAASSKLLSAQSAETFARDEMQRKASDVVRLESEIAEMKTQLATSQAAGNSLIEAEARASAREQEATRLREESKAQALEVSRLSGEIKALQEVHGGQLEEMKALAADARMCVIERQAKEEAQGKLRDALTKTVHLEEQVEQLHVLRSTDASRANQAATDSVQDQMLGKESEVQRLQLELEQVRGDLEASRNEREAMVVRQTQTLQDEMLRVNTSLTSSQKQVVDLQGQLQALQESKQQGVAADSSVIQEYKNSLELKDSEIEALRRTRDQELRENVQELERLRACVAAEEAKAVKLRDELVLSREENDNLKRKASALGQVEADLVLQRTASADAEKELSRLREEVQRLGRSSAEVDVMREKVRSSEMEVQLANSRLEKLEALERQLERKERDLDEERERHDRLRNELKQTAGGNTAERGEWETKYSLLEKRLEDVDAARHKAEFDLTMATKERNAMDAKYADLTDELAGARVRMSALEAELKVAQDGEGAAQSGERMRDLAASKDRYERKYRETQKELKEAQETLKQAQRRVKELEEALDSSIGPTDSDAREAIRRAEEEAARERDSRKAIQAQLDVMNDEYRRLKDSRRADADLPPSSGPSDSSHLQLRVRSLLRENAECHAQIRLLGAEVVGLSEALEIVTKRAHDGEARSAQIQTQVEHVTRGVASTRGLRPSDKGKSKRVSGGVVRAPGGYSEHDRHYYPNELYPSRAQGTLTPPPQRPASADRRRRPSSAGRVRPSSARTGRESSEFTAWLETDRVSGTILSRAQEARNEAWGLGDRGDDGSMMPRLQARHRDPAAAVQTREEVYHGASGGGRDRGRSP